MHQSKFGKWPQQAVKLGSNLGPTTSEYGRMPGYKTQNQLKRTYHIALASFSWAQGVVGSNPIAPTNIPFSISKFWKQLFRFFSYNFGEFPHGPGTVHCEQSEVFFAHPLAILRKTA